MATATLKNKALHSVRSVRIWSYSCPHFSAFGLKTESEYGKMWTRITPNTDTFYAVWKFCFRWKESLYQQYYDCYAFSFISQYFLTSLNLFTFWLYYTQRLRLVPTKDKTKITLFCKLKIARICTICIFHLETYWCSHCLIVVISLHNTYFAEINTKEGEFDIMYFLSLKLRTFFWIYCYDINCSVINCTQSSIKSLNKNWSFPLRIFQVFQVSANLVIFTEEILNEKLYFLYSEWISVLQLPMRFFTSFFSIFVWILSKKQGISLLIRHLIPLA